MVVGALAGIAVGMGIAAWWSMRWTCHGHPHPALVTVAAAALVSVATTLVLAGPVAAVTLPGVATLAGFAVAFISGGDESGPDEATDPPWWPSFERDLRRYERRRKTPR